MLSEDNGGLPQQNVTQNTAANSRDYAQEDAEQGIAAKSGSDGSIDASGSENAESQSIGQVHNIIIFLGLEVQVMAPPHLDRDEETCVYPEGNDGVGGI